MEAVPVVKSKMKRKRAPKSVLKLPDLEQSKSAVLNSLTSPSSQRTYDHAIREFIEWYLRDGYLRDGVFAGPDGIAPIKSPSPNTHTFN